MERRVVTGEVDSRWLYNNFFVGLMIIDARPREAFAANTLVNAINIPPIDGCGSIAEVETKLPLVHKEAFAVSRRMLKVVVIVGDTSSANDDWRRHLQKLLVEEGIVVSIAMLAQSFDSFCSRYAFYTTQHKEKHQLGNKRVTYPNEILEGFLYLGNLWQAESKQIMGDLGITHVVNATLDIGNVFQGDNIEYHEVKIPDNSSADIASHFDATFKFIHDARQSLPPGTAPGRRNRVFVHCTQGISRSATIVLMYLMRAEHLSFVEAFNLARNARPVIIPNNGFLTVLMEEERRLFGNMNSLEEAQMDELLQGRLDDRPATIPWTPLQVESDPLQLRDGSQVAVESPAAADANSCQVM